MRRFPPICPLTYIVNHNAELLIVSSSCADRELADTLIREGSKIQYEQCRPKIASFLAMSLI